MFEVTKLFFFVCLFFLRGTRKSPAMWVLTQLGVNKEKLLTPSCGHMDTSAHFCANNMWALTRLLSRREGKKCKGLQKRTLFTIILAIRLCISFRAGECLNMTHFEYWKSIMFAKLLTVLEFSSSEICPPNDAKIQRLCLEHTPSSQVSRQ